MSTDREADSAAPPLRVLIVDDSYANAETTGWMVELFGYDYRLAGGAAEALAVAETFRPDVALLDIGLPDINGFELCIRMQALPACKDCVFVAQTGWGENKYRERADEVGFHHYLLKPFDVETLETLLHDIANKR